MNRIVGLDVIRIVAIMGVVIYHFNTAVYGPTMTGDNWGGYGVILFFILSGYLLRITFSKNPNLKNYYTKRFLSIFPLLWVTFIIFYFIHSIRVSDFFYGGNPLKLLLSLAGFDSYYVALTTKGTYAIIGEWFTGAILILYLIFPFLNELLKKNVFATSFLIYFLYYLTVFRDPTPIAEDVKIFITIGNFWTGMVLEYLTEKYNPKYYWLIPLVIIYFVMRSHRTWILYAPGRLIMIASLFMIILIATKDIHLPPKAAKVLAYFSDITFAIYLVHHVITYNMLLTYKEMIVDTASYFKILFFIILVTTIIAALLYWLTNCFIKLFSYTIKATKKKPTE